jgi:hypothetical protein
MVPAKAGSEDDSTGTTGRIAVVPDWSPNFLLLLRGLASATPLAPRSPPYRAASNAFPRTVLQLLTANLE